MYSFLCDFCVVLVVPNITSISFCMSTVYWSPPLCDANCTVSVDGQDIDTVPCKSRNLSTDDSNLSNKMVMIVATDAIGSSHNVSMVLISEGKFNYSSSRITIVYMYMYVEFHLL